MKIFICCLIASVFYLALADVKIVKESAAEKKTDAIASDKSSDSKPKRDATLMSGVYHGPSYKYLPPSSIYSFDAYPGGAGNSAILSGGHISGRGQSGHGYSSYGHHKSAAANGLGYAPASSYHGSGHHGLGFTSSNHYAGHVPTHHSGAGFRSGAGSNIATTFGHGDISIGRPHSHAIGHGSSGSGISGVGYKSHSFVGGNTGSGSSYPYSKVPSGSFPFAASPGFGPVHGSGNSYGSGLAEVHHGDHVHNGAQEHVYVISSGPSGFGSSHGTSSIGQQGHRDVAAGSYFSPVQQHPLPSNSYGVPLETVGETYTTKYHSQGSAANEHGPTYAAGHKGLGHFSFTSNKPQVLHTSISGSSLKQPSYSKAPFKPSTFLGVKFEGSAHHDALGQQYLPPPGVGSDSTGYEYPIPSGPLINYQEPSYQQSLEVQTTSVHESDSSYLPPSNNESSLSELPSAPGGNYFPLSNTYGVPFSH